MWPFSASPWATRTGPASAVRWPSSSSGAGSSQRTLPDLEACAAQVHPPGSSCAHPRNERMMRFWHPWCCASDGIMSEPADRNTGPAYGSLSSITEPPADASASGVAVVRAHSPAFFAELASQVRGKSAPFS